MGKCRSNNMQGADRERYGRLCRAVRSHLAALLILMIILAFTATSYGATAFYEAKDNTIFDAKYSFSPRFITGKTTVTSFGGYNYDEDMWNDDGFDMSDLIPIRLTEAGKGRVGVIYHNVGEYGGETVDMRITVASFKELRPVQTINGKKSYPCVFFKEKTIGLWTVDNTVKTPTFRVDFLKGGTKTPMTVSGHITFKDIDLDQYVISTDLTHGYLSKDTRLSVSTSLSKVYSGDTEDVYASDKRYWFTGFFDEIQGFSFIFTTQKYEVADFSEKQTFRGVDELSFTGETFAPFETPKPIKNVNTTAVYPESELTYTVSFTVPQESTEYYYSSFILKDVLPAPLLYTPGSFAAADDTGASASSKFTSAISGQTLTVKANDTAMMAEDFYNKTYKLTFKAKLRAGYDYAVFAQNDGTAKVLVQNKASLTTKSAGRDSQVKTSNQVSTEVQFRIDTSAGSHGSISEQCTNISGGGSRTVTYSPEAGYRLLELTVDGVSKSVSTYPKSYDFKDIYDNHKVAVTFTPITTNEVTVTKRVHKDDVNRAYGMPAAIFKLTGTDVSGNSHTYYKAARLDAGSLSGEYYQKELTFSKLTSGKYTLSEVKISRYELAGISGVTGGTKSGKAVVFDLVNNREGKATYTNDLNNYSLFSHSDVAINKFK